VFRVVSMFCTANTRHNPRSLEETRDRSREHLMI
jgi:hypothetical protein